MDDLLGPAELGDDFVVGESGQGRMRPGVDGDLVASHVLLLQHSGKRNHAGADGEEGRLEVNLVEVCE